MRMDIKQEVFATVVSQLTNCAILPTPTMTFMTLLQTHFPGLEKFIVSSIFRLLGRMSKVARVWDGFVYYCKVFWPKCSVFLTALKRELVEDVVRKAGLRDQVLAYRGGREFDRVIKIVSEMK